MIKRLAWVGAIGLLVVPTSALAANSEQCAGLKAVSGSDCTSTALTLQLNTVIDALFIVAGAIAVLITVMGGIRYITSTGDAKRIQAAKDTILYAVIGLVISLLAFTLVAVAGKVAGGGTL